MPRLATLAAPGLALLVQEASHRRSGRVRDSELCCSLPPMRLPATPDGPEAHLLAWGCPVGPGGEPLPRRCPRGAAVTLWCLRKKHADFRCSWPFRPLANRPMYREDVQWREFANDVNAIRAQPYLEQMRDRNQRSYPGDIRGIFS